MNPHQGRGRGEIPTKLSVFSSNDISCPTSALDRRSSSESGGETEPAIRGRAGYLNLGELKTIPDGIEKVKADASAKGTRVEVLTNFVPVQAMEERSIHQYRVDFEPQLESVSHRRRLFYLALGNIPAKSIRKDDIIYDGSSDARSGQLLTTDSTELEIDMDHPVELDLKVKLRIRKVGTIAWSSFEMLRLYNMNMRRFLKMLGFFQISGTGAFVHPDFRDTIKTPSSGHPIVLVRGYKTACAVHEQGQLLINLESVHKLVQWANVLQEIKGIVIVAHRNKLNIQDTVKARLIGKLVVPNYNRITYRIEDVSFELNPASTFASDRVGSGQLSYFDYYKNRYDRQIVDLKQPLLRVIDNCKRSAEKQEGGDIYLVPELCNIAGLTDDQRNDSRLKMDLIKITQVCPRERVSQHNRFLKMLHQNVEVRNYLSRWGYNIGNQMLSLDARILPTECVGVGRVAGQHSSNWPKVDNMGSFERAVVNDKLAVVPPLPMLAIVISRSDAQNESNILGKLKVGMSKIGLKPDQVKVVRIVEGDTAHLYANYIRNLPELVTAAIVIMSRQNKERFEAIKKVATVERGLLTQVVTSKLMLDDRKANSAAIKIGIQIAAKLGGEPWYISIPVGGLMICGYDTYHDTSNRGRSFGAFVASTNRMMSRWFSKADKHEKLEELSTNLAQNMANALAYYSQVNGTYPERVVLYRDGASDGQLDHVFHVELKRVRAEIERPNKGIKLTVVVVNKKVGARFFMKNGDNFLNPPPGSVVDQLVTRQSRYDFYLISQSTRNGSINPSYYNIIYDKSGFSPDKHQMLAFKLCFLYYNWTGTVRVPAPCQYAHKLAYLCGEHLHTIPNSKLDDRLHFL